MIMIMIMELGNGAGVRRNYRLPEGRKSFKDRFSRFWYNTDMWRTPSQPPSHVAL